MTSKRLQFCCFILQFSFSNYLTSFALKIWEMLSLVKSYWALILRFKIIWIKSISNWLLSKFFFFKRGGLNFILFQFFGNVTRIMRFYILVYYCDWGFIRFFLGWLLGQSQGLESMRYFLKSNNTSSPIALFSVFPVRFKSLDQLKKSRK